MWAGDLAAARAVLAAGAAVADAAGKVLADAADIGSWAVQDAGEDDPAVDEPLSAASAFTLVTLSVRPSDEQLLYRRETLLVVGEITVTAKGQIANFIALLTCIIARARPHEFTLQIPLNPPIIIIILRLFLCCSCRVQPGRCASRLPARYCETVLNVSFALQPSFCERLSVLPPTLCVVPVHAVTSRRTTLHLGFHRRGMAGEARRSGNKNGEQTREDRHRRKRWFL
jgi:hypothetical protein